MNIATYYFVFLTVLYSVSSATIKSVHLEEGLLQENSSSSLEVYHEADTFAHQRMARHIELESPSVNNLVQIMSSDLTTHEKDRKHKFVRTVFKKLMEKIEAGVNSPKDDDLTSSSNRSTAEENTKKRMKNFRKLMYRMVRRWPNSNRRIYAHRRT
ncbi:uncharacterized protein LOC113232439 [Hyposmocoma kahamanoa]|uniref:uncharacterized protein LOC113232439 n=1 Tax=Hyposmocoma kahamanoa TaxID=1477025 RepID=UPI000E6D727E|nr:uncharacterized protein LOC113232439 [Hyposmocoma kahamanoa]